VNAIGLWAIAARSPGETAVYEPGGAAVTYAELAREADRYGRGFQSLGLSAGDTVAALLPNGVTALAVYFAAIETGLYVVPVNWHQVAAEVAYILSDSAAGVFVAHERFAGVAGQAADLAGSSTGSRPAWCRASSRSAGSGTTGRTSARPRARTARRCCTHPAPPAGPKACAGPSPAPTRTTPR
jgi:long-chain acyl-CoA synthetase